jgi:regulator of protease activity HflC (stomatin/prohibitin superfamily)
MSWRMENEWRGNRPSEDPEKTKRWGFVTAKPSEFLVHVRRGRVLARSSGQGASCFKWPRDSVAVVPTSLQRLSFKADQVTRERVGVEVAGLAVYRVAEPLLAYRVVNFSYPERAQQKLEETLTAMFVGATRRLVATLSVDDCLEKRKEALAGELLREITPIVGGEGRPDDSTQKGWGIVIDTIEIQEVRVLSERVFAAMQAPYRAALEQRAREARAQSEAAAAKREMEVKYEAQAREAAAKLEQSTREQQARYELAAREAQAKHELQTRDGEANTAGVIRHHERAALEAQAETAANARKREALAQRAELQRAEAAIAAELKMVAANAERNATLANAEGARAQAEVERLKADAQAKLHLASKLPELAAAIGQRAEIKVHQIGDGAFSSLTHALESVVALAKRGVE